MRALYKEVFTGPTQNSTHQIAPRIKDPFRNKRFWQFTILAALSDTLHTHPVLVLPFLLLLSLLVCTVHRQEKVFLLGTNLLTVHVAA